MKIVRQQLISFSNRHKEVMRKMVAYLCQSGEVFSVLDIGCRYGQDLRWLAKECPHCLCYGVDIDKEPLKKARQIDTGEGVLLHLAAAKAEALPFRRGVFDLIISSEVIEHSPHIEIFLSEARRVLKSGGFIIITTPERYNYIRLIGKLIPSFAKRRLRRWVYYLDADNLAQENPHYCEYSHRYMRRILERQGFRVRQIGYGTLRIPAWGLFERVPFLFYLWEALDYIATFVPFLSYLKHNFILQAVKE